jgi:hypothetical protein
MGSATVDYSLACKYTITLKWTNIDERTSLSRYGMNYVHKIFYSTFPKSPMVGSGLCHEY